MRNWKTTLAGLFAAAGQLLPLFGVDPALSQAISAAGITVMGVVGKDAGVTGTEK